MRLIHIFGASLYQPFPCTAMTNSLLKCLRTLQKFPSRLRCRQKPAVLCRFCRAARQISARLRSLRLSTQPISVTCSPVLLCVKYAAQYPAASSNRPIISLILYISPISPDNIFQVLFLCSAPLLSYCANLAIPVFQLVISPMHQQYYWLLTCWHISSAP